MSLLRTLFAVCLFSGAADARSSGRESSTASGTPFAPTAGWTYHIEAVHQNMWPDCPYRFLSYDQTCSSVDMYNAVGSNQEWTLVDVGSSGNSSTFYLRSSCGSYLSYSGDCSLSLLDQWGQAGSNQQFRFISDGNSQFQYYIETIGRNNCDKKYASFPTDCTTNSPDVIDLWSGAGENQRFRLFPVRGPDSSPVLEASSGLCADPFVFYSIADKEYYMQCTGGDLALSSSPTLKAGSNFASTGTSLGGSKPEWAQSGQRWAPETFIYNSDVSYLLFSDAQPDGVHRIGWTRSSSGIHSQAWDTYSSTYMTLSKSSGGEIDQNVFYDSSTGKHYLLWKSDDNSVGDKITRIWMSEISVTADSIEVISSPQVILDSSGLWWIDSWVSGGSLIEGPELVKPEGSSYYYLFFAAGKYCQDSYAEGVARSTNLWGPYEKMGVPLLSTGAVGRGQALGVAANKLVGPGHASVERSEDDWFLMWHASIGENCDRYPFITPLLFGKDGWPYVKLT